ncbi:tyrosine-type recombinase/integrase [Nonomuraea monospora]|uniref:Tyrosine-type recombinase/integrase n=1 Tax=Nonomuraea monospora TaxID=568818 RepID=A0ABP5PBV6_9ACTN
MNSRPTSDPAPDRGGLLGKLMAAVRPEFRVDVLVPELGTLIFNTTPCLVRGCVHQPRTRQLCRGHYRRWQQDGRPDLDTFVATTPPSLVGRKDLTACAVEGCRYGAARQGLCVRHHGFWDRAGKPDLATWLANQSAVRHEEQPVCHLAFCTLWAQGSSPFCLNHKSRWYAAGQPDIEEFTAQCESRGDDRFDFRPLNDARQVKLELQYAVQCRHDERQINTASSVVNVAVRLAALSEATSLLDWPIERWAEFYGHRVAKHDQNGQLAFLRYAHEHVEDLQVGGGWETEFPRDVWRLHRLGIDGRARLRFDRIPQPWLRNLTKRFVRWRLSIGRSVNQAVIDVLALTRFAGFLARPEVTATQPADLGRPLLERYLADLTLDTRAVHSRNRDIASLNAFFYAVRRHEWDPALPANAMFYPDDFAKTEKRLPRGLAEQVMAQVEQPANLDRWRAPEGRLLTLILMRCGLRVGDATKIALECVIRDADGAPYLRYFNNKMKREALVPIDEELDQQIAEQQRRVLQRWPDGTRWLFPAPRKNPDGARQLTTHSYRGQLNDWLQRCDVRDEHGRPVHLTPHQWRHTFATRLINRDVPQEVVQVLLDHSSGEMTAHYARLHDSTVRRHWEKARKVNARGESVTLSPDGPLAEASWAKQRLGRVTQALPNGFCGLPVQKTCPHANACLTCPMFVTTPEFLPQHHQQRQQVLQIMSTAEARGQLRLVEMNQQVLGNLDRIITALEEGDSSQKPEAAADAS